MHQRSNNVPFSTCFWVWTMGHSEDLMIFSYLRSSILSKVMAKYIGTIHNPRQTIFVDVFHFPNVLVHITSTISYQITVNSLQSSCNLKPKKFYETNKFEKVFGSNGTRARNAVTQSSCSVFHIFRELMNISLHPLPHGMWHDFWIGKFRFSICLNSEF